MELIIDCLYVTSFVSTHTDGSSVVVELTFQRIILYHLTNTYLTTLTLLVIVEVTLFCQESQLEMAIGLTLTTMLVMYTMYQVAITVFMVTILIKQRDYFIKIL